MSTVPVVFSTALYALKYCADLQRGEVHTIMPVQTLPNVC